jgi:hypothetical protein
MESLSGEALEPELQARKALEEKQAAHRHMTQRNCQASSSGAGDEKDIFLPTASTYDVS